MAKKAPGQAHREGITLVQLMDVPDRRGRQQVV